MIRDEEKRERKRGSGGFWIFIIIIIIVIHHQSTQPHQYSSSLISPAPPSQYHHPLRPSNSLYYYHYSQAHSHEAITSIIIHTITPNKTQIPYHLLQHSSVNTRPLPLSTPQSANNNSIVSLSKSAWIQISPIFPIFRPF